jgi:hypothetical protein
MLSVACGGASGVTAPAASPRPSDPVPPAFAAAPAGQIPPEPSRPPQVNDPVCGTGLGNGLGLADYGHFDISETAPSPPPITDSVYSLRITPGCEHGDRVTISPPSAARITKQALTADGLTAGVQVRSNVPNYEVVGTGATPFVQKVELNCAEIGEQNCRPTPQNSGPSQP